MDCPPTSAANQQVIFVVPYLSYVSLLSAAGPGAPNEELLIILDEQGNLLGTLPDMVWLRWLQGEPPSILGASMNSNLSPTVGISSSTENLYRFCRPKSG